MKRFRFYALFAALALVALPVAAQSTRPFENSWYWGLKGGTLRFATNSDASRTVGTLGGDWVITRTQGGLYVSFDMANFVSGARIEDSNAGGGFRRLQVNDLRRVGIAGMVFPARYGRFRPYGGIGVSLDLLGDAGVVIDSTDKNASQPDQTLFRKIDDRRSQVGLLFLGGAQAEIRRLAVFAQASVVPNASRFLIGRNPLVAVQFGLRYNVGTSIDRPH